MEENKNNGIFKSFMTIIVTALITCIVTTIVVSGSKNTQNGTQKESFVGKIVNTITKPFTKNEEVTTSTINNKLNEINQKLNQLYIGEIDEQKLIDSALEGYVQGVGDEYTEYLTEEEVTALMEDVNGSYVGVGLYIAQNVGTNEILVVGVIEGSPANKAGILVGDIVKKVDDIEFTGEQLTQASNNMKGVEGTKVKVTVERNGENIDFDITREKIKFNCISSEKLENNIGYIRISSFDGGVAEDFEKAYKELSSQGIKSLVIDLRNNGGGLVDQCLEIAELIVPKGSKMLITKDKQNNEEISTSSKDSIINVPIVILVNEYTASASEILTAAIRENVNATVIGTKTYGKGVIQGIYSLDDQVTALKITMQEYYTPNHNKIHKQGITPDIVLELPEEWKGQLTVEREYDNQLNKAVEILSK